MSAVAEQQHQPPQAQDYQPRRSSVFRKFVGRLRTGSLTKHNHKGSLIPDTHDDAGPQDKSQETSPMNSAGMSPSYGFGGSSSSPPHSPEVPPRSRKTGSFSASAANWTAKIRTGRRESNTNTAAAAAAAAGAVLEAGDPATLWNEAYDSLRDGQDTAKLVSAYESIVTRELPKQVRLSGANASFSGCCEQERLDLLTTITTASMTKSLDPEADPEEVDLDDDTARDMIASTREAVEEQLEEYPATSLAWAGLCTMTPAALDTVISRHDWRGGLIHVVGRVSWYMQLGRLVAPSSWSDAGEFQSQQAEVRRDIVDLYRNVLEFQMNCVCAAASSTSERQADVADVVCWDDIRSVVRAVMRADEAIIETVCRCCATEARRALLDLDKDFKTLEERQEEEEAEKKAQKQSKE
ncbi:hypothetical protein HIM_11726 [Hirsutella minnesotensis 3608]|uniref:NWD NACHT-NTPase N-terminal domain-containing protein n=1 Tax=Hirsutella minnesotensis 3608 TaxID=1043627 RepID=A0A0F7ZWF5_9HYPO|nr:hypothetical protein HIM_11726 [Hirsutella minnesotensis 3608]